MPLSVPRPGMRPVTLRRVACLILIVHGLAVVLSCGPARTGTGRAALVGVEAVPAVEIVENHSEALPIWASRGVSGRVLLHVDGHIDMDWIPPGTIEAIRRGRSAEAMGTLQVHPHDLSERANHGFGIWDFVFAAFRLGLIRQEIWVVPDGSLSDRAAFERLRALLAERLSGVSLEEYRGLRYEGGLVTGTLAGVPVMIAEIERLPRLPGPVLLDIDLDYFTTVSASDLRVLPAPRPSTDEFISRLRARGVATDLAVISLSTIGGFAPFSSRHLAEELRQALRDPAAFSSADAKERRRIRFEGLTALGAGEPAEADRLLASIDGTGGADAALQAARSESLRALGRLAESSLHEQRALELDPEASRLDLHDADVLRANDRLAEALELFRTFAAEHPDDAAAPYARRRIACCLLDLGRYPEAAAAFEQVLAQVPDHADSNRNLAQALVWTHQLGRAIPVMERACRLRPHDASTLWEMGTMLLLAKDHNGAESYLRRAVAARPAAASGRYNLAVALAVQGRIPEALREAEICAQLTSNPGAAAALLEKLRAGAAPSQP